MWNLGLRYPLRVLTAAGLAAVMAAPLGAAPRGRRPPPTPAPRTPANPNLSVNFNAPNFPNGPFRFQLFNPLAFEAAREQNILFNRGLSMNQPIPPMNAFGRPFSVTPAVPSGVNPFWNPLVNGPPSALQAAYNASLMGNALSSFPPAALGINPFLSGGGYAPPIAPAYPSYGYGGGSSLVASPGGYSSPYGGAEPYGGYMSGSVGAGSPSTATLTSTGIPGVDRQAVRRAQLDTRRRAFDEYLYERLNSPTHEDLREFTQHQVLRRSLNEPPATEVWSGAALNTLLNDVQKLQAVDRASNPSDIPLDEDVVKRLNVNATASNIGLLKDGGRLAWPLGLRALPPADQTRELRSQVGTLLQDAVGQAANGKVDPSLLQELSRDVSRLQKLLVARANDLPEDTYIEARQFLNDLDASVRTLRRPDAGDYLSGRLAAKGSTVQKLVQYMTEHGLQFGPAVRGDEGAYNAVHRALARYDMALRGNELRRNNDTATAPETNRTPAAKTTNR